jgi:hypothetical protein
MENHSRTIPLIAVSQRDFGSVLNGYTLHRNAVGRDGKILLQAVLSRTALWMCNFLTGRANIYDPVAIAPNQDAFL